jgi:MFS family permease
MALLGNTTADTRHLLRDQVISAQRRSHQFYVGLTLFLIATVVIGFWPSYFGTLLSGGVARPFVMHLHGAIFTGWMALLFLQVGLAASGRVRTHRRVGKFGIGYGALVWIMGVIATFAAPVIHVQAGEWGVDQAAGFLILPIGDMVLFGGFFGAAVKYRHKPEIHKRLIVAATVALAFAAVARMNLALPIFFLIWMVPMVALAAFDFLSTRKVHAVTALSIAVMAIAFPRVLLVESERWLVIGRALLRPFLQVD